MLFIPSKLKFNAFDSFFAISLALVTLSFSPVLTQAETIDFGGKPEKFAGRGDRTPPTCQVQAPSAAGASFLILWNCEDDDAAKQDIRSELWILRNGSSAWELANQVLGFPAATTVDAKLLRSLTVKEGLPASFRVVGIDRAGNATISPSFIVNPGDASTLTCALSVVTNGTETDSTGSTTGVPSRSVVLSSVPSEAIAATATAFTIKSATDSLAATCEIDTICSADSLVGFAGSGVINAGSSSDVSLSITPGAPNVTLSGSVTTGTDGISVTAVSLSGTTTVETEQASVTLECSSSSSSAASGADTGSNAGAVKAAATLSDSADSTGGSESIAAIQ